MIWTVLQVNARRLMHNRIEMMLTFVVPIAFFSIFAVIFGGGIGNSTTPKINVVVVNETSSQAADKLIESLQESPGLRFKRDPSEPLSRKDASQLVRHGVVTMAIILKGDDNEIQADLLADASNQVAGQVATALVSRALMIQQAEQKQLQNQDLADSLALNAATLPDADKNTSSTIDTDSSALQPPVTMIAAQPPVTMIDVMGDGKTNPVVSMYAAGIAVMFLLFGATGGGGALLEERESLTLDRLLSTRLSMDELLLGKWFYLTAVGIVQVSVMFLWGQIVFDIDLLNHLDGFLMMTVVTASAAAAFGLCLATICKTRGQLNGLSVIVVLAMSALGGSMVPRYVMSDGMREAGLWTFNAWALDGYDKVFWRELPVGTLWPQLTVLMLSGAVFLVVARILAIRWETD